MAIMAHRTTFALDDSTIRRLKRLAKAWRVSQAEVVRRALERAEHENDKTAPDPLARLQAYHESGGLDARAAAAYLEEVAENRAEWGRDT
jgi:predicted transcriptional regulator